MWAAAVAAAAAAGGSSSGGGGGFRRTGDQQECWRGRSNLTLSPLTLSPGAQVPVGIHPSNIEILKLKIDKDRKSLLEKKAAGRAADLQKAATLAKAELD